MPLTAEDIAFGPCSKYYDLFYRHKNYHKESSYILSLLQSENPGSKDILELGSGTGNFSALFCEAGYCTTGIERSESMNALARLKKIDNFYPTEADMKHFDLNREFDGAIALFDVMCYLTSNADIISSFRSISKHVKKGGCFIFDCWYSPAVYSCPPITNTKKAESLNESIIRISEPHLTYATNTVEVKYEFIISDKLSGDVTTVRESHQLRHFSTPEIVLFAELSGFKLIRCEEPVTGNPLDKNTWKACYILQKI